MNPSLDCADIRYAQLRKPLTPDAGTSNVTGFCGVSATTLASAPADTVKRVGIGDDAVMVKRSSRCTVRTMKIGRPPPATHIPSGSGGNACASRKYSSISGSLRYGRSEEHTSELQA